MYMNGKLIVFEGTDASGKETQARLVKNYLEELAIPSEYIDFPRYQESLYGQLIGRILQDEFGPFDNVDPHLFAAVVAADRKSAQSQLIRWLEEGKVIVSNRYTGSNKGHQTARLPKHKRDDFLQWLEKLEYEENALPREDIVMFLYVPPEIARELNKKKQQRVYLGKEAEDSAEKDFAHQKEAVNVYLSLVEKYDHWVKINCVQDDTLRTRDDIQDEIRTILHERGIF